MYTRALFLKKSVFLEISAFLKTNNSTDNSTKPSAKAKMKSKVHNIQFSSIKRERARFSHLPTHLRTNWEDLYNFMKNKLVGF